MGKRQVSVGKLVGMQCWVYDVHKCLGSMSTTAELLALRRCKAMSQCLCAVMIFHDKNFLMKMSNNEYGCHRSPSLNFNFHFWFCSSAVYGSISWLWLAEPVPMTFVC